MSSRECRIQGGLQECANIEEEPEYVPIMAVKPPENCTDSPSHSEGLPSSIEAEEDQRGSSSPTP
jgi:hypothetical protein